MQWPWKAQCRRTMELEHRHDRAATAMALQNDSSVLPRPVVGRNHSREEGCGSEMLSSCGMLTMGGRCGQVPGGVAAHISARPLVLRRRPLRRRSGSRLHHRCGVRVAALGGKETRPERKEYRRNGGGGADVIFEPRHPSLSTCDARKVGGGGGQSQTQVSNENVIYRSLLHLTPTLLVFKVIEYSFPLL